MRTPERRPLAIDLYAGAGGLSLGLEQAGFDIALAVERDPYHVATHRRNFPYGKTICASITELTGVDLLTHLDRDDDISLICGGPPCQGFSHMGKRYKLDPRNTLVDEFVRLVLDVKPKAFLMENVPGMQGGTTAPVYRRAVGRLSKHYTISTPVRTLNAADFGVPQKRARLFILGIRRELGVQVGYPDGPCREQASRPTVWQAIEDLPTLTGRDDLFKSDLAEYSSKPTTELHPYTLVARGLHVDPCDLSYPREWNKTECTGCLRIKHRPDIEKLYAATPPGGTVPAHNLPKLDPAGLAPTLRAGTDSEHGSFNAPRPVHPYEPRCISVREAARLHGYPDWFRFHPTKWHAHRQIGNSVCPPVARALGAALAAALGMRPVRPSQVLTLSADFSLPPDSKKHHKRIPQIIEWPKVLEYLVKQAEPAGRGRVKHDDFSVEDVRRAYKATEAKMPRTPPGHFLQDIARSRNRRWLLAPVFDAGLSILPVSENGTYGRFVPIGTPGTLEDRNPLAISSTEIAVARSVSALSNSMLNHETLAGYLETAQVSRALFQAGLIRLDGTPQTSKVSRGRVKLPFSVCAGRKILRRGIALITSGDLPTLSSVGTVIQKSEVATAIIISGLTARHFAVVLVRLLRGRAVERRRTVFAIEPPGEEGPAAPNSSNS